MLHPVKNRIHRQEKFLPATPRIAFSKSARFNEHRRRLDRALNQQAELVPPLRRAGDFFAAPEQIEFFVTGETLPADEEVLTFSDGALHACYESDFLQHGASSVSIFNSANASRSQSWMRR